MLGGSVESDSGAMFGGGGGRMAALVRDFDWSRTSLGPWSQWPPELKTVVRQILESRFPAAVVWGPDFTTIYNDAFRPILGDKPEPLGRSFADIWSEVWDEIGPIAERAYAGEATYVENYPLVIDRTGAPEQAWFTFCYSPLRLHDGTVAGMIDTVVETTATMNARADLDAANNELGHRLKNTLAMVQAIASQTLKDSVDPAMLEGFRARIGALGHAHDMLLRGNWADSSLTDVVRETLAPLDGLQQIEADGPDVALCSHAALNLALILHELATNAAKYGALSVPSGHVALTWAVSGEMLHLSWRETGGPPVAAPAKFGFGSRLIDRGLGRSSLVERRFTPQGFELDLALPVGEL